MRENANSNVNENANRVTCSGLNITFLKCDMCKQNTKKSHITSHPGKEDSLLCCHLINFSCFTAVLHSETGQEGTGQDRRGQEGTGQDRTWGFYLFR